MPTVVSKVSGNKTGLAVGATTTVNASDITVVNQYGLPVALDSTFFTNYKIKVSTTGSSVTVTGDTYLTSTGDSVTLTALSTKGTQTVNYDIYTAAGVLVANSTLGQTFKVVDKSDIASYEVADVVRKSTKTLHMQQLLIFTVYWLMELKLFFLHRNTA